MFKLRYLLVFIVIITTGTSVKYGNISGSSTPSRKLFQEVTQQELEAARITFLANQPSQETQSIPGSSEDVNATSRTPTLDVANVDAQTLRKAREIVAEAQQSAEAYNAYLVANPRRNQYSTRNSATTHAVRDDTSPPTYSDEILAAARLVAEVDAAAMYQDGTLYRTYRNKTSAVPGEFWMEGVPHVGTQPYGGDPSYKVYRNVKDYGAVGNGLHDDTAAINVAIADGKRCGYGCNSTTVKAALVYFPSGTYLISTPIIALYNTLLVGDGYVTPTLLAARGFLGTAVIDTNVYIIGGKGAHWYLETSNFYRQIENFNIDLRNCTTNNVSAIHWQVAQATSLYNLYITMDDSPNTSQIGLYTENGSGGFMDQLSFIGGYIGIYGGNQQYTTRSLFFDKCKTAISLVWDWGWTWKSMQILNCGVGIRLYSDPDHVTGAISQAGSIYLQDTVIGGTEIGIWSRPPSSDIAGTTVITLDNLGLSNVGTVVWFTDGSAPRLDGNSPLDYFVVGDIQDNSSYYGNFQITGPSRPSVLTFPKTDPWVHAQYFFQSKPMYSYYSEKSFVNMKHYAKGDGVTDDTAAINTMLTLCASSNTESNIVYILYFPAGSYIVTSTIFVPINSYIVGEAWAQIVASGAAFEDMTNPTVMVQVGKPGDIGSIQISDMLFTSTGPLAGLVAMEWNVHEYTQGSVAMWDSHFRIGGALGSKLQVENCPTGHSPLNTNCIAASMLLHVTTSSSGYFENVWAWVADHDIDDPEMTMVEVYSARGILIESQGPVWLYGTTSEHSVLYQYQFFNASNVYMGMIQTETPYFQGIESTAAPAPFDKGLNQFNGDPTYWGCRPEDSGPCASSWALMVTMSRNIYIAGAAHYSWFQNYNESCVDTQNCQQRIVYTFDSTSLYLGNLITIGAVEMVSPGAWPWENTTTIYAKNNTGSTGHPWWSLLAGYFDSSEMVAYNDDLTLDNLNKRFPGIWWNKLFISSVGGGCVSREGKTDYDRIYIIAKATQWGVFLANFGGYALPKEDAYFHRFFYRNRYASIDHRWTSSQNKAAFDNLHNNLLSIARWIVNNKDSKRGGRIAYSCTEYLGYPAGKGCQVAGVDAWTGLRDWTTEGTLTVFCPQFFTHKFLEDITNGEQYPVDKLGSKDMRSYEKTLVHEWMHATDPPFHNKIVDIKDSLYVPSDPNFTAPIKKVYGADECHLYAWKFIGKDVQSVNIATVDNADNYAFYFYNKWFATRWGWHDDGTTVFSVDDAQNDTTWTVGDDTLDGSNIPEFTEPTNCQESGEIDSVDYNITCSYDF